MGRNAISMQSVLRSSQPHFPGGDDLPAGHLDRMQSAVQVLFPERKKLAQHRIARRQIQILPDVFLQKTGMVRHMIHDAGRRQAIVLPIAWREWTWARASYLASPKWTPASPQRLHQNMVPTVPQINICVKNQCISSMPARVLPKFSQSLLTKGILPLFMRPLAASAGAVSTNSSHLLCQGMTE